MARTDRHWILRLSCRADQQRGTIRVPLPCRCALASATLPRSQRARGLGTHSETGGRVSPKAPYPSSVTKCAVCRQTPQVSPHSDFDQILPVGLHLGGRSRCAPCWSAIFVYITLCRKRSADPTPVVMSTRS